MLNSGKMRHVAGMSSLYVFGAVRARTRKGPIHREESSERDGRGSGAEQVYLMLQVTNLKNKEVTVNPEPQTLEKNPIP